VDEDGQWFLHGRSDEAMNVAGRKIGPAEVETALLEHPGAAEAAVIGVPDPVKGEAIVAFVVMKPGAKFSAAELMQCVGHSLGPAFRPEAIYAVAALPKTQSGKIVRRLIRSHFLGEPAGDSSTLADPGALAAIPRRGVKG
jgi:acetyl-CoA synthetase